ncbi:MAG: hypothetical protein ACI4XW_10345, partial [Candidatus Spyradocola sp.]
WMVKTDEELIEERIETFVLAYNSGDFEAVADCLDSKNRNAIKSALGIAQSIGGALFKQITGVGLDISLNDIFGLAMGYAGDVTLIEIEVNEITLESENRASVSVTMTSDIDPNPFEGVQALILVKEKGDWFIKDIKME